MQGEVRVHERHKFLPAYPTRVGVAERGYGRRRTRERESERVREREQVRMV